MSSSSRRSRRNIDAITRDDGESFIRNTRRRTGSNHRHQTTQVTFQSPPAQQRGGYFPGDTLYPAASEETRGRNTTHINSTMIPFVTPSPHTSTIQGGASSIRDSARNATYSRGIRDHQRYLMEYFQDRHINNPDSSHPDMNRICYCDQPECPSNCPYRKDHEANNQGNEYACPIHKTIRCTYPTCDRTFHVSCIQSYEQDNPSLASGTFVCSFHGHMLKWQQATENSVNAPIHEIGERLGIDTESRALSDRSVMRKIREVETILQQCNVPSSITEHLKNTPFLPYPSIVKMKDDRANNEAKVGRQFEVSMLMFSIDYCSCCGLTQPIHRDPFFPKESPLPRYHLSTKFYDAWECNCILACKGQQFYGANRPLMMSAYKSLHNNEPPDKFISGIEGSPPNARLCNECYWEYKKRDGIDICDDILHISPMFSIRNGFGGKVMFPPMEGVSNDIAINLAKAKELNALLSSFTAAEEAAIRQITPLLSIVRLKEGNIGAKGNTHLVWQQSKLSLILPNLPSECKFIILKRPMKDNASTQHNDTIRIRSTTFERCKIEKALSLLIETVPRVWKSTDQFPITLSQDRLAMWPERGDLAEMNPDLHILEKDEEDEGEDDDQNSNATANNNDGRVADGNDFGPAPLQNAEEPDEIFEGVMNFGSGSNYQSAASIPVTISEAIHQHQQNSNNDTATFNHADVLPIDGFANMAKTPYAWARAFPTIFIPEYLPFPNTDATRNESPYLWQWVIRHDPTSWVTVRDKHPKMERWYRHMMWRHDGAPAAHPTFSLALFNYKSNLSLQRQGQFVVNTSDIDPESTIDEIFHAADDDTRKKAVEKVINRAHCHSANVAGTPRYWRNTFFEFEATTRFNSHVLGKEPSFFITNSLADHHEFPLRLILHNYTKKIHQDPNNQPIVEIEELQESDIMELNDDTLFSKHSQIYKTVVTHYFASKLEIWYAIVLQPIFGIDLCILVFEFQSGRGAIHAHAVNYSKTLDWNQEITRTLHDYALYVHSRIEHLDRYIEAHADTVTLQHLELHRYDKGMESREKYLMSFQEGIDQMLAFNSSIDEAKKHLEQSIATTLETNFGFSAMHHGDLPSQWVKPGGQPDHGYRSRTIGMSSSKDVLETKELKKMKFQREDDLLNRRVNITNHCGTHKCSQYCIKYKIVNEPYNASKHTDDQRKTSFIGADGREMVPVKIKTCRMHFGTPLKCDYSGENNITGGIPFSSHGIIHFDKNQLPKYSTRRNHPRIIDEPSISLYFGANNDIQPLLINSTHEEVMAKLDNDPALYEKYFHNLLTLRQGGLEHFNASHIINQYLTSYQCKGGKSTEEWQHKINQLTASYCNDLSNSNKTLRSLIGKHMHEIPKAMSITRDQSQFMLGGGVLKRTSYGSTRKCSVSSSYWNDLVESTNESHDSAGDNNGKRFTWPQILSLYKKRSFELYDVSVYKFCCCHWPLEKKEKPTQFFGFNPTVTWPLEENYSKWILTLYYPWVDTPDELMQPTFAEFLGNHYVSNHIPSDIRAAIARAKSNLGIVQADERSFNHMGSGGAVLTPTLGRNDERLAESAQANEFHHNLDQDGELEGMDDYHYIHLPSPNPDIDWTKRDHSSDLSYDDNRASTWIVNERELFYQDRCSKMLDDATGEDLELFDEHIFRPENARGDKQRIIVYMLLFQHYRYFCWKEQCANSTNNNVIHNTPLPPPSIFLLVEGKPGSGKSFILKTLRNISRVIMKTNKAELTSAPTGVAGSLINASTHCRVASIPTGKEASKPPSKIRTTNYQQVMSLAIAHQSIFTRLMDEHSMMGRKQFGWMKHRMEELRRPFPLLDDNGEEVLSEKNHPIERAVYERHFGGIPFVMSCGDFAQLPAVMDKMLFDNAPGQPNTADSCGKIAFAEFISSSDTESAVSAVVIMDEVVRQDDPNFKLFLDNVANGSLTMDDVDLIRSRCLENLSEEEQQSFKSAIHLVPTWAEASDIVFHYLCSLGKPIAKWKASYSTSRRDCKNCCFKEKSYPSKNAMCVGAVVMLLKNFIVEEWKLLNGSVGTVIDIIYANPLGPREEDALPLYIVVDFKYCCVPEDRKCFHDCPSTYVAIPVITERCEKGCCSVSTIPLRVCIAITTYKGQGITVGPGEMFEQLVIHLPINSKMSVTGQELVQFSRAKDLKYIAIGNSPNDLVTEKLLKIGKNKGNEKRKEFLQFLSSREEETFAYFQEEIQKLSTIENNDPGSFDDGCDFLLRWYRSNFFDNT